MYLSLVSDWDLDVAFVSAAKPYLQLKMDIKPSEDSKNTCVSIVHCMNLNLTLLYMSEVKCFKTERSH